MCDQTCACDEGTSRPEHHCCLYDHPEHAPERCCCDHQATTRTCIHPDCGKSFKPRCGGAIFCSHDCFFKSNLKPKWDDFAMTYENDTDKTKQYLSKKLYRRSDKGKAQRQREYEKYNPKRRERRRLERERSLQSSEPQEEASTETVLSPSKSEPKQCRRPGCLKRIVLKARVQVKHFCSEECRNAFRNIRKILKTAYKNTRCPRILLARAFLLSL